MAKIIIRNGIKVYKNHRCKCGCGKRIPWNKCHRNNGIPDYIHWHHPHGFKKGIEHPRYVDGLRSHFGMNVPNGRRRGLNFIPINEPFEDSEQHHLDKYVVMFIPKKLHRSIFHSLETGQGMTKMNNAAYSWFDTL